MTPPEIETQASPSNGTTASLLTGVGRSAIAVIRLAGFETSGGNASGANAAKVIDRCFVPASTRAFTVGQIRYGQWRGPLISGGKSLKHPSPGDMNQSPESVVVLPIGDDTFEIHCHGGVAATERIFDDLRQLDVLVVDWHDSQHCASESRLIGEAVAVLANCVTARTAAVAMDQVRGALLDWCHKASSGKLSFEMIRTEATQIAAFASIGLRLTHRFCTVLAGAPNVGKSSLINAIVGFDRSITLDQPGTTRDVLHAETVIDGLAIQLSDTAGLRVGDGEIEKEGIRKATEAVSAADLVIWVSTPDQSDASLASQNTAAKAIHVLNKADLLKAKAEIPTDTLLTVATTRQGIPKLLDAISNALAPDFPPPGSAVPITTRQRDGVLQIAAAETDDLQQDAIRRLLD